ncbi:hypothetical protein BDN72DRAFT_841711 [Pluteus cervinus]|uniref:Uncharacterized protein n=1 Tax=Pluteus cervinus TaxID=181527 RepID=A0ACD3ASN3_9AGAR|nr:hypothetical protein BDN72DRAFT_841711 [Pluteus cervinus]
MDSRRAQQALAGLPPDAVGQVTLEARKEGIFAGLTSGLAAAIIGARLMGFNRNKTLLSGVLGGALAGYYFTQAFTSTALAQLHAEEARLATKKGQAGNSP